MQLVVVAGDFRQDRLEPGVAAFRTLGHFTPAL
jgi:hypothetical protein